MLTPLPRRNLIFGEILIEPPAGRRFAPFKAPRPENGKQYGLAIYGSAFAQSPAALCGLNFATLWDAQQAAYESNRDYVGREDGDGGLYEPGEPPEDFGDLT